MRNLACLILLSFAAAPALASSHSYYKRTDARRVEAAREYLDSHGMQGVTVRAFRGRLTLGGALPADAAKLAADIQALTGAISVHV
jgi:hypothetical protein